MKINLLVILLTLVLSAQKQETNKKQGNTSMEVSCSEENILIQFFGKDKNMDVSFFPCGVNQIVSIGKIVYYSSLKDHHAKQASYEFTSGTDWIGPYFICGAANKEKGLSQRFTGGWHGSNGDGTGAPTASTKKVIIKTDGKYMKGNFDRLCKQLDLTVTNLIQGYDDTISNKNLIKETVRYRISPDREINVYVKIEALNDLIIQRYYGLQSQNFSVFDSVSYATPQTIINTEATDKNSRCQTNEGINSMILTDREGQYQLKLILDISKGLGTSDHLGNGAPKAFSASYGKSYFNLVNGLELPLKKGESVFWNGMYIFN